MEIPIYIGTEPIQWLPTEVLKYSICKRTEAKPLFNCLEGIQLNLHNKMYTGFSFYRFCIPQLCGYEGRAIYLDADMVVVGDIVELYELEMEQPALARPHEEGKRWYTSCMLLDCGRLNHWKPKEWVALINAGLASYGATMNGDVGGLNYNDFGAMPQNWNHLDHYNAETKLLHYTNVPTQPWKRGGHPHRDVFLKELNHALHDGALMVKEVVREIEAGHIYPEILEDMEALFPEV